VVVLDQDAESVVGSLATMFQTVEPPRTVLVEDPAFRGPIKAWTILRCRNFLGYDPEKSAVGY
jgi:hypothetical protein